MKTNIQNKIDHVIILMMENRSFDNLLGWLYEKDQPHHFLPKKSPEEFNGLAGANYSNPLVLNNPASEVKISKGVDDFRVPNPDPNEKFKHMNQQLFGLDINKSTKGWLPIENTKPNMKGFLADYVTAKCCSKSIAPQIMQTYTSDNLNVLSQIAKAYAVSDNYHASSPTQTWPNRAFMHAGTSEGKVNNFPYLPYTSKTIFNVFEDAKESWNVYKSSKIIPSLTRIQMTQLWDPLLDGHFHHVSQFIDDCESGNLPAYSFIEPSFVVEKGDNATSEHPPANVCAGDYFLQKVFDAVSTSPVFDKILFIINFDEHGGCPDHEPPNWTAVTPDSRSNPGDLDFKFNRYGVRVPAIFVSPHIEKKTCVRANDNPWSWENPSRPFDHTSVLAMLLDWKCIDRKELPSERVQKAPKHLFDDLLSGECRQDRPQFAPKCTFKKQSFWRRFVNFIKSLLGMCADGYSITSLQESILIADLHYRKAKANNFEKDTFAQQIEIDSLLNGVQTEKEIFKHFKRLYK